jgi:DNA polymerase-4
MGPWYRRLARGVDSSPVDGSPYVARGRSRETTFQQNLTESAQVETEVRRLAEQVAGDLSKEGRPAVRVTLKVRYAPFQTHTRSLTLAAPTADPEAIAAAAVALTAKLDADRAVRLLGVHAEMAMRTGEADVSQR